MGISNTFNQGCLVLKVGKVLEQFKTVVPSNIATNVNKHNSNTAMEAAAQADEYVIIQCCT